MVRRDASDRFRREALLGRDGPVVVHFVLNLGLDFVVTCPDTTGRKGGLVGELVLYATEKADGLAHNALEVLPAGDKLE